MWELVFVYEMLERENTSYNDIGDQSDKRNIFVSRYCDLIQLSATDEAGIYYINFRI
jgi:hypothetical protein